MRRLVGVLNKWRKRNVVGGGPQQKPKTKFFTNRCEINGNIAGNKCDEPEDNRHSHDLNNNRSGFLMPPDPKKAVI